MRSVGLFLVGHIDAGSLHVGGDYPELYQELLGPHGINLVTYRCDEGQFPASLDEQDGWLCSPSRLSVYDDVAWLRNVEEMLREIVRTETPFVGICFGHQLLAQALGGTVRKADVGWGIGAKEYAVHATKEWMDPPRDVIRLAASHQDQVIDVPADATVWADSDYCPNGGMFVGERAWTLQVHPEFSPPSRTASSQRAPRSSARNRPRLPAPPSRRPRSTRTSWRGGCLRSSTATDRPGTTPGLT